MDEAAGTISGAGPPLTAKPSPQTLGNMRELGVRSLAAPCELYHHEAVLPADRWGDAALVLPFKCNPLILNDRY